MHFEAKLCYFFTLGSIFHYMHCDHDKRLQMQLKYLEIQKHLFAWTILLQRCQPVPFWWKMLTFRTFTLSLKKLLKYSEFSKNGNLIFQSALQRPIRTHRPSSTGKSIPDNSAFSRLLRFSQPVSVSFLVLQMWLFDFFQLRHTETFTGYKPICFIQ